MSKDGLQKNLSSLKTWEHSLGYVFGNVTLWQFFPQFVHRESSSVEVCLCRKKEELLHLHGNRALRHQLRHSNNLEHVFTEMTEAGK